MDSINEIVFEIVDKIKWKYFCRALDGEKLKKKELKKYNPEIEINLMKSIKIYLTLIIY